jgi:hypothetical protein
LAADPGRQLGFIEKDRGDRPVIGLAARLRIASQSIYSSR